MCTAFYTFSQLPLQGRTFGDDITITTFRSYPSSWSSINTQAVPFLLRFSPWNRPRKILGGRKDLIKFLLTKSSHKFPDDRKVLINLRVTGKVS